VFLLAFLFVPLMFLLIFHKRHQEIAILPGDITQIFYCLVIRTQFWNVGQFECDIADGLYCRACAIGELLFTGRSEFSLVASYCLVGVLSDSYNSHGARISCCPFAACPSTPPVVQSNWQLRHGLIHHTNLHRRCIYMSVSVKRVINSCKVVQIRIESISYGLHSFTVQWFRGDRR